jgi:hypothetical protein
VVTCRFPNGTVAIAPHLKTYEENWPGGFARKPEEDQKLMESYPPPPDTLALTDYRVNGHTVSYSGTNAMSFRVNDDKNLIAFAGENTHAVTIDGVTTTFADQPLPLIAWGPVQESRRVPGGAVMQLMVHGSGTVQIPLVAIDGEVELIAQGPTLGSRGEIVPATVDNGVLTFDVQAGQGRWLYVVPKQS